MQLVALGGERGVVRVGRDVDRRGDEDAGAREGQRDVQPVPARRLPTARGVDEAGDVSRPGFLMRLVLAVVGALIVLAVYRLIKGRSLRAGA